MDNGQKGEERWKVFQRLSQATFRAHLILNNHPPTNLPLIPPLLLLFYYQKIYFTILSYIAVVRLD